MTRSPEYRYAGITDGNLMDEDGHVYVGGVDGTRRAANLPSADTPGTGRGDTSYGIVESHLRRKGALRTFEESAFLL